MTHLRLIRSACVAAALALGGLPSPAGAQDAGGAKAGFLGQALAIADSIVSWCIQAEATSTSFCRESMKLMASLRPAAPWPGVLSNRTVRVFSRGGAIEHQLTFCAGGGGSVASRELATGASDEVGVEWHVVGAPDASEVVLLFDDGEEMRFPLQQAQPGHIRLGDAVSRLEETRSCE